MELQKIEIDFSNPELITQYGVGIQKNLSTFSEKALLNTRNKETFEIGKLLNELMLTLKGLDIDQLSSPGLVTKLWHKVLSELSLFKGGHEKINDQLNELIKNLEEARTRLLEDIKTLEEAYGHNLSYFQELEQLIEAGEEAMRGKNHELHQMEVENEDYVSCQKKKDLKNALNEFEKRIHDLKLTRTVTLQTLPQIKLIQHNNCELVNKIQSSVLNTVPVWKNLIMLTLSLEKQKRVALIQKKISQTTHSILMKNSELLKENTVNIAKISEEGIVEIQALQRVNDDLVSAIGSVLQIYQEGKAKRHAAEKEILEMERRLRATLAAV